MTELEDHDWLRQEEERPPFLRTWPRVYVFILCYLLLLISLLYWFMRSFAQ